MTASSAQEVIELLGLKNLVNVHDNLSPTQLIEESVRRSEALLSKAGALVIRTGITGRSPKDKFIVSQDPSKDQIDWGEINRPISAENFSKVKEAMIKYFEGKECFFQSVTVGADPHYRIPVRVISENACHALFAETMFIRPKENGASAGVADVPGFTILHAPSFKANPKLHGTRSEVCVIINFEERMVLIAGTAYAGEIKKSVFSIMNYLLPLQKVMAMHCSANYGNSRNDVALFFGLSGTGKTTLSADPDRTLIGDDEHGWTDQGVFNFEGGCYAKTIGLKPTTEPEIYATTQRFGTILENVVIDPKTREIDLMDDSLTENTRGSYPIEFIPNMDLTGQAGHPKHVIMLTCDAFGVLPPIAKLTPEQAMYHFLSGYTAKVAGTEAGITEPKATFSACFGAPFMPLPPSRYATLLGERISRHQAKVWLVNTGWSGGAYGTGKRMSLDITRAVLKAALSGELNDVPTTEDPIFGLAIPQSCPGVDQKVLNPRETWADKSAYDKKARELAKMFQENFAKNVKSAAPQIIAAGPNIEHS